MKLIFSTILSAIFLACGGNEESTSNNQASTTTPSTTQPAQAQQQDMIVGEFQKEDLEQAPFSSWFNAGYSTFDGDDAAMKTIKENINDYEIVAFMGTWCGDSKREVPKVFKILDEAGYDLANLKIIGMERSKTTPQNLEEGYNITRVPTVIFMKDGKEVNRYVERPIESIEKDFAKIVSGKEYKDAYSR